MAQRSLVDNSTDPQQVERAQRIQKERDRRYRAALVVLAHTPEGEILFERIAERAAFFTTSFSSNPHDMAFNEGRRGLGLEFLHDWTVARPDALANLLQQRATEEKRNDG